jgi:hypothetical protein
MWIKVYIIYLIRHFFTGFPIFPLAPPEFLHPFTYHTGPLYLLTLRIVLTAALFLLRIPRKMSGSAFELSLRWHQIPTVPLLESILPFYNLQKPCNLRRDLPCNMLSIFSRLRNFWTYNSSEKMLCSGMSRSLSDLESSIGRVS